MSKLEKKFIIGIICIMASTLILSVLVNTKMAWRFYLHQQTRYVDSMGDKLWEKLEAGGVPEDVAGELEAAEHVLIAYTDKVDDSQALSDELRARFREKGLGFKKFWLWDQDYDSVIKQGRKIKIYNQEKLNYGILVEYLYHTDRIYAVAAIVPNTEEIVGIINWFLILLSIFSLAVATMLMAVMVRHITRPLQKMERFAGNISRQVYKPLEVRTGDELETVAESMNQMSRSIQEYQAMLVCKNQEMKGLLDNVSHDLKTPCALIGMYASGIKDGLDDGTFLDTIVEQNTRISRLTEQLLCISRISQKEYAQTRISLDDILKKQIQEQKILARSHDIGHMEIRSDLVSQAYIQGNEELTAVLFSNLLNNGLKYSAGQVIEVRLARQGSGYLFAISNEVRWGDLDLEHIWDPFYVGETSRNKALSGTGLGLAAVREIAKKCGYGLSCGIKDGIIRFEVTFN